MDEILSPASFVEKVGQHFIKKNWQMIGYVNILVNNRKIDSKSITPRE